MSGDTFEDLFRREYPAVLRTVALIVMSREVAEEVTQEAFARLYAQWSRIEGMDKPGAWVRRVAIREGVKRRNRARRRRTLEASQVTPDSSDVVVDVDVMSAIGTLPPQQRAAVVLRYYEDLSIAEVAVALGCAEATARVHLYRARASLAERLGLALEAGDVAR